MNKKCKIDGCEDKVMARGLCRPHYYMAKRSIERGRIKSWEELIELGISEEALSGRNNAKRDIFERALSNEGIEKRKA